MQYPKSMQPTHARWEQIDDNEAEANSAYANTNENESNFFPTVKPIYSRNYMIVDTVMESAPASNMGIPGPDSEGIDLSFNGLSGVSQEIRDTLPAESRAAFEEALAREKLWKGKWNTEMTDGCRRDPRIDKGVITL